MIRGMRRTCTLVILLSVVAIKVFAQQVVLRQTEVVGLPDAPVVLAYAVVEAEDGNRLIAEVESEDGVRSFYVFVYAEGRLIASPIGPRTIPARFDPPPTHRPRTLRFEGEARRYWPVHGVIAGEAVRFLSAPSLAEQRFTRHVEGVFPESPELAGALSLSVHALAADQSLLSTCTLEPNILAAEDRMTTTGGWMIEPFDERLFLVGMAHTVNGSTGRIVPRLYSEAGELVAVSPASVLYNVNAVPEIIQADLTGDGVEELILFPTGEQSSSAMLVLRIERNQTGRRVLAFNLCSSRMSGEDVIALQMELSAAGYDLGVHGIDGWYGPDTRAAVIEWQRDRNASVTGVVDLTRDSIE